jgi:oligopeptide transport system substrate-binding protein
LRRGLASACCLLLLAGCSRHEPAAAPAEKILRLSQRNEPATLDPQLATLPDEFIVLRSLLEGLVAPNPTGGTPVPAVAARWETSPDGLTWTFHLQPDVRWSDGAQVTSRDFVYTIRRALNPALGAPKAALFYVLRNAEAYHRGRVTDPDAIGAAAPDNRTLVLTLERPAPHLLALLASGPWLPVPAATVTKFGDNRESVWARPGSLVSNGPFTLAEWRPHQHLLVRRNPSYHQADRVRLDGIRFQIYDSGETEERAFRAGQVDVTMAVPFTRLSAYAGPVLQSQPLAETRYLALNTTRAPLDHPLVRRALALALDRPALVDQVLRGGQQSALTFVPPGLGGYAPSAGFKPDVAEARRLLAEAGYPEGKGLPVLELSTWTNTPVLEAIQQMWRRELGVQTTIVQREAKVHLAALAAGDFAVAFVPAIPDYDDAHSLLETFSEGAPGNYPHWHSARYDAALAAADLEAASSRRLARLHEAEAILLAEMPVVPIYFNTQNYLLAPRVRGWQEDRLWTRFYLDVTLNE